jgi:uncharacterized protein YgfB (UPF0149 family)
MLQVTFSEVVRVLEGLGSSVPAAEAHGCLVGALCTSTDYPIERWLEEIIPDQEGRDVSESPEALRLLYSDTLNALRGTGMEFEVLLPDDDIPLAERAGGLSQWCQGFLYGFGTGPVEGARKRDKLPGNVNEILNDFTHISRATVSLEEAGSESEEEAYAEVVEYVRVGVQLIHDELIPAAPHRIDVGIDRGVDSEAHDARADDTDDRDEMDQSDIDQSDMEEGAGDAGEVDEQAGDADSGRRDRDPTLH